MSGKRLCNISVSETLSWDFRVEDGGRRRDREIDNKEERGVDFVVRNTVHSYELPEIIAIPIITGYNKYLAWLGEQFNLTDT